MALTKESASKAREAWESKMRGIPNMPGGTEEELLEMAATCSTYFEAMTQYLLKKAAPKRPVPDTGADWPTF